MHYKTNRLNHDFQIAYFLAGSCHTADAAYSLLCDLREDRLMALRSLEASKLRKLAAKHRVEQKLLSDDAATRLEAQADVLEMTSNADVDARNEAGALDELKFIELCIAKIKPYRKFSHLPDSVAHEAAQQEEWKRELLFRVENSLLTTGSIAAADLAALRMHPEYKTTIVTTLNEMMQALKSGSRSLLMFETPKVAEMLALENTTS